MELKNLAETYTRGELQRKLASNKPTSKNTLFNDGDIINAFKSGAMCVIDRLSNLRFKEVAEGLIADTIFDYRYRIVKRGDEVNTEYSFSRDFINSEKWYSTIREAMEGAKEDYKNSLKIEFGLTKNKEIMVSVKLVPFMRNAVNKKMRNEIFDCGFANGYVAVPREHPLWGKSYEVVNNCVDVHGGVTFGRAYDKDFVENIIRLSDDEIPEDSWIFGFDTLHFMDNSVNCDETFCRVETMNFLRQLENIGKIS